MNEPILITASNFPAQTILLVDDNEDDAYLFQRAWQSARIVNPLKVVSDGEQAIAYLQGDGPFADRTQYSFPLVVLLDLNMPRKNGFEFLDWVRRQPALRSLTVEVLTSSMRPEDVERALQLGANSFFVKPGKFEDMVQMLRAWHDNACQKSFIRVRFP